MGLYYFVLYVSSDLNYFIVVLNERIPYGMLWSRCYRFSHTAYGAPFTCQKLRAEVMLMHDADFKQQPAPLGDALLVHAYTAVQYAAAFLQNRGERCFAMIGHRMQLTAPNLQLSIITSFLTLETIESAIALIVERSIGSYLSDHYFYFSFISFIPLPAREKLSL